MVFLCKIQILNPNYNNIIAVIKSGSTYFRRGHEQYNCHFEF
jgi:hypothetical protein